MRTFLRVTAVVAVIIGLQGQRGTQAQELMELQQGPPTDVAAPAQSLVQVPVRAGFPRLTVATPTGFIHAMPTVAGTAARRAAGALAGPLLYHAGGSVVLPFPQIYSIYWVPPALQNGGSTGYSANYPGLTFFASAFYPSHGLDNNNTQYYQTIGGTTTYINNFGGPVGVYFDSNPLPASGCTDTATPGNCITDAQIQAEITRVMGVNGWTGGLNKIFVLFTSSGEGSCFTSASTSCAYTQYCAYHGSYSSGGTTVLYANMPYANTSVCQASGQTEPNGDVGDLTASVRSHEITETITDPLGNAWFDASGNEIGDLCNFNFGTNTWAGPMAAANQMWNGFFFEMQQEWDNHTGTCVQVGP